jgi:hypothetical protein
MSFEAGLTTYLKAHAGLVALVGARIYPLVFPEGTSQDCLVYQVMTGRELHLGDYVESVLRFGSWSKTFMGAIAVDAQLREALEAYHGMMGTVHVRVMTDPRGDDHEPETGWYRRKREARPLYKEPGP